ncbi:MAG: LTA synthase family protein [Draconibacterium sp.]|nr:LTA synthase family protein [Draconibacterium sp.]
MILVVRFYELIITSNFSNYPPGSSVDVLIGLKFDFITYLRISAFLMIPFLIIAYFSQKAAKYFFIVSSILLVLGEIMLLQYFTTARIPLGADLFGYSVEEIQHTVAASGSIRIFPYIMIMLYLAFMVRIFVKHVYYRIKPWAMVLITILMFGSLLPLKKLNPEPSKFSNEFCYFVAINKLSFFTQSVSNYYVNKGKLDDQPFTFKKSVASAIGNPFSYIDPDYPFLHQETTPNVLGEYFELGETPTNIVFILVESLGRAYSGEDAYLGSFTPFLDSLMRESLYWENCLSTSGRTFQVLPSTLASLPYGNHGFTDMGDEMPDHLSLISILKKEAGYNSTFVYGGDASFDKMDIFLRRQGIDQIIDVENFGADYTKLPASESGFTWGYGDKEIFRRYIEDWKLNQSEPRIDAILTLAMHSPFKVPDQLNYNRKFEERLIGLDLSDKTKLFNRNYVKQFATIIYFDEALRYFFNEIKKLPAFKNTIFVITGDHRMPEIPISTQIDRFHVPLVIYSPMLKKTKKFSSVVTHFDLTPSILALLNKRNNISRPTVASWIGHGLDNSASFRNLNSYVLMRNKNEIMDILDSKRMLANNTLYQLYPNMNIEPIDESNIQEEMEMEMENFIRKQYYVNRNNKLIPDSLKKWAVHLKAN